MSEPIFSAALAAFKRSACCCGEVDKAGTCGAPACTFGDVCRALARGEAVERERDEALAREAALREIGNSLVRFNAGPVEAKRPAVFQWLMGRLATTLATSASAALADLRARVLEEARERIGTALSRHVEGIGHAETLLVLRVIEEALEETRDD